MSEPYIFVMSASADTKDAVSAKATLARPGVTVRRLRHSWMSTIVDFGEARCQRRLTCAEAIATDEAGLKRFKLTAKLPE